MGKNTRVGHWVRRCCGDSIVTSGTVYSQSPNDETPERIRKVGRTRWSVMRSGWDEEVLHVENGRIYSAFSIDETVTATDP